MSTNLPLLYSVFGLAGTALGARETPYVTIPPEVTWLAKRRQKSPSLGLNNVGFWSVIAIVDRFEAIVMFVRQLTEFWL